MFNLNQDNPCKIHVCYICKELGHYANNCPNPKKPQDYVHLSGNCKTTWHPTYECPRLEKEYPPLEEIGKKKKEKRVRIQVLYNEERGSRNENHIQHFSTSLFKEPRINVVTTRSWAPMESYPIIDENSNDSSSKELMVTLNKNDHRNKSIMDPPMVTKTTCTLVACV